MPRSRVKTKTEWRQTKLVRTRCGRSTLRTPPLPKRSGPRNFGPPVFSFNPSLLGPLINTLKYFCKWLHNQKEMLLLCRWFQGSHTLENHNYPDQTSWNQCYPVRNLRKPWVTQYHIRNHDSAGYHTWKNLIKASKQRISADKQYTVYNTKDYYDTLRNCGSPCMIPWEIREIIILWELGERGNIE